MFDFGRRLCELRKQHHLSQKDVGERLNISKSSISKYESNQLMPSLDSLIKLSVLYNVTLDYITGIERHRTLVMDGLSEKQCLLLESLCSEMRSKSKQIPTIGLTPTQLHLLNEIIVEFSEKN